MILRYLSLLVFCIPVLASAHKHHGHHHHHDHEVDLEEISADGLSAEQYRKLLDEAHHTLEDESATGFSQRWLEKFNFKKILMNAYRWRELHKNRPEVANAAANIVTMLVTSHTVETIGGLTMASAGVGNGFDDPISWLMTTVGVTITIPGLDPLCIVLVGAYGKWPKVMDRWLTYPRLFIVKGTQAAGTLVGLSGKKVAKMAAEKWKARFLQQLSAAGASVNLRMKSGQRAEFTVLGAHEGQSIVLEMKQEPNGAYALDSVHFSPEARAINRVYLKSLLKPFGANIRSLLIEIGQRWSEGTLSELSHLPYIESVEQNGEGLEIKVKPAAFPFHSLESKDFTCQELLTL